MKLYSLIITELKLVEDDSIKDYVDDDFELPEPNLTEVEVDSVYGVYDSMEKAQQAKREFDTQEHEYQTCSNIGIYNPNQN